MRSPRTRELGGIRGTSLEDDVPDWQSTVSTCSSTVATTASLASRIASLALDLEEDANKGRECEELGTFREEEEEEEEEEVVLEVTDEQLLQDQDPFQVCSRLFRQKVSNPIPLKRLGIINVEEFKQHGYLVVDNFITKEVANAIREEALRIKQKGRMLEAHKQNPKFQDKAARDDCFMWLHLGRPPLDTAVFAPLVVALQELQEDLQEFMRLRNNIVEYQLAHYPGNGTQYVKHRDAFPDDGSDSQRRRVTAIVYTNTEWKPEDEGPLRVWPPRKIARINHAAHIEHRHRTLEALNTENHSAQPYSGNHSARGVDPGPPSSPAAHRHYVSVGHRTATADPYFPYFADRRTLAVPVLDRISPRPPPVVGHQDQSVMFSSPIYPEEFSVSEPSECGSLRSDCLDHVGIPKSTTSSAVADVGWQDGNCDLGSVDDMSVASRDHDQPRVGIEWVEVGGEMVLEVAPVAGRMVLFLSGAVNHRVMPSHSPRVTVTAWFK